MRKVKHLKMGRRLIRAMKEVVDHVEGKVALPMRYVPKGAQKNPTAQIPPSGTVATLPEGQDRE